MHRIDIQTLTMLSEKSGVELRFLEKMLADKNYKNNFIFDHEDSEPMKNKFVRVAKKGSELYKLHKWINLEISKADNKLPFTILGGLKGRNLRDAVSRHIRKVPFCFVKSDLKGFFESNPYQEVFSLFCGMFHCSKKVSRVIANSITMTPGPIGSLGENSFLARGFNPSSRVAIWININFFHELSVCIWKNYKKYKPRITFYIDNIGVSIKTLDTIVAQNLKSDIEKFVGNSSLKSKHLVINLEKTSITFVEKESDFVNYLGVRLYQNRVDLGDKTKNKSLNIRNKFLRTKNKDEKKFFGYQLSGIRRFGVFIKTKLNPKK